MRCARVLPVLLFLLLSGGAASAVRAQESGATETGAPTPTKEEVLRSIGAAPDDTLRLFLLGEIVVTADRWRETAPAVRTETLSFRDLAASPSTDAQGILKSIAGVEVSAGRKDEAGITIRGFGSRRVAIMVDGRPMNIPYYGTFDLGSLHADKLEEIVVVRGPASVTYGPNVMGGVVNFVTARGRDHPGTRLSMTAGNHNTGEIHLTHGLVQGPWDLLVSARGGGSDGSVLPRAFRPTGYPGTEDGGYRNNSDRTEYDLFAKLGYRRDATDLALAAGYDKVEKGVPGAIDEERYWRFTDWRRYFADLTLRRQLDPRTHLEAKGYGDVFINTLVDYEDDRYDLSAVFYNSTHRNWDLGGLATLEHDWSNDLHGAYGCSLREDQIKKRMNPDEPWLYHHQVTGALYAEHQFRLSESLSGAFGLAGDAMLHNHLRDVDYALGYSAGLSRGFGRAWRAFASAGRSARFPTLSQLWGDRSGNQDLHPEIALRYETGIDGEPRAGWKGMATLFYNRLLDMIDRDVYRAGRYYNIHEAHSYGAEIEASVEPCDWLAVVAAYTYTETENRDTGEPLDLVPEHKLDGRIMATSAGGETQWVLVVTRVGARFDSESLSADRRLPAYVNVDCRVTTRVNARLTLSLEILNLGDVYYEEEVMYPAPGRTLLLTAGIGF